MLSGAFALTPFDARGPGKATGGFANYGNGFAGDLGRVRTDVKA
jgi:hypothetical protein